MVCCSMDSERDWTKPAFASGQVGLQIAGRLSVRPGQAKVKLTWAFQARLWRSRPASWGPGGACRLSVYSIWQVIILLRGGPHLQISEDTSGYLKMPADTWRCLQISEDAYRYLKMPADIWRYRQISEDAYRYLKMPKDAERCLRISGDAYRYQMPTDTRTYQKISKDTRTYLKIPDDSWHDRVFSYFPLPLDSWRLKLLSS